METHFLAHQVEGEPEFRAEPWYNPYGDCVVYQLADEPIVAERVDKVLTIYRSANDNRPIGFQIKGVLEIIGRFGLAGLLVLSSEDASGLKAVSVAALLLAAYELDEPTFRRRRMYASVLEQSASVHQSIPVEDLVAA